MLKVALLLGGALLGTLVLRRARLVFTPIGAG